MMLDSSAGEDDMASRPKVARPSTTSLCASAVRSALDYTWRTLRDAEQLGKGQFVPRRLPLDFCS